MCLISIELQLINDLERECPPETPGRRTKIALARLLFIQGFFFIFKRKSFTGKCRFGCRRRRRRNSKPSPIKVHSARHAADHFRCTTAGRSS